MMSKTNSIKDSTRVFIGGLGVAGLAWLWWHGYVFRPFAEPVAAAIVGPADGKVGSGEFANLLASWLTGMLWIIGEIIWIALTVCYRFTSTIVVAIFKWLLAFTDAGKDALTHVSGSAKQPKLANVSTDVAAFTAELQADPNTERIEKHSKRIGELVKAYNAMSPTINAIRKESMAQLQTLTAMQANAIELRREVNEISLQLDRIGEAIGSLEQAKSFAAWQKNRTTEDAE